jgi:glycolate oxidase
VELDGFTKAQMQHQAKVLHPVLSSHASTTILEGHTDEERHELWKLRGCLHDAMTRGTRSYRDLDIAVPLSNLQAYLKGLEDCMSAHGLDYVTFGHALDGNLHTMILLSPHLANNQKYLRPALTGVYKLAVSLRGCISGEHGIGLLQKDFLPLATGAINLELMRNLKKAFDPHNLLNPGKIF